ncbi:MAG: EamA family transporter, partial [Candidatus Binatia bacterium]
MVSHGASAGAALAAALLFGATTPAAKLLLDGVDPVVLAGFLYLGSGLALGLLSLLRGRRALAGLSRADLPWLAGAIASGGVLAPVALLWGLARIPASSASLLLSFEASFTALLAALLFREHVGARVAVALGAMTAAGALLAGGGLQAGELAGFAAVTLACLAWALDNNLTREIAHADARTIATLKGLFAGSVNLAAALAAGAELPALSGLGGALGVGAIGYGVSLSLYVVALRELGSSRTAGFFATAPVFGAALSVVWVGEPMTASLLAAAALMAAGVRVILSESHSHAHRHPPMEHAHRHVHDEHHRHPHEGGEAPEPHVHRHRHEEVVHEHPHAPDLHHRHGHSGNVLVVLAVAVLLVALGIGGAAWLLVGRGVSARDEPSAVEAFLARRLRDAAIPAEARQAKNPVAPSPEVLSEARDHYADHCAVCHGNDGSGGTAIGENVYPPAPDLAKERTQSLSDGEIFY